MPHSSGGGSHSGGSSSSSYRSSGGGSHSSGSSYSSSSHSSSSYSSGSYSSGIFSSHSYSGSSGSYSSSSRRSRYEKPRVEDTYFSGAKKYVRYSNGTPSYIYANTSPSQYEGSWLVRLLRGVLKFSFGFHIVCLLFVIGAVIYSFVGVKPITADYNSKIVIVDGADIIADTRLLEQSMTAFLEQTGIAPAVMTVNNEDWQPYYSALENYAYDLYVNAFNDEYHWLWVYSQPKEPDPAFNDWFFQGMQGDNTNRIITQTMNDKMVDSLQKGFTKQNVSIEQAFEAGFDEVTDYAVSLMTPMSLNNDFGYLLLIIAFFVFLAAIPYVLRKLLDRAVHKKYSSYVPADSKSAASDKTDSPKKAPAAENAAPKRASTRAAKKQRNCSYCGSLYFVGTDRVCPQCGAPIKAE